MTRSIRERFTGIFVHRIFGAVGSYWDDPEERIWVQTWTGGWRDHALPSHFYTTWMAVLERAWSFEDRAWPAHIMQEKMRVLHGPPFQSRTAKWTQGFPYRVMSRVTRETAIREGNIAWSGLTETRLVNTTSSRR
jgi:hypothetical protein